MTPEQTIEMAKQTGVWQEHIKVWACTDKDIQAFAQLVRNAALEAAAVKCENPDLIPNSTFDGMAQEIRSLKS